MFDSGKRTLLAVMLCVGLLQIVSYYLVGALSGAEGNFAIAQPDTLLYCQAARRIVEGHPFSFSAGTAVSTGTTSHLYPFLLALPYWLGTTGETLFRAGFVLNALFYLVFLFGWWQVVSGLVRAPYARMVAGLLVALVGQAVYSALAQSDVGLWMAVSALLAAGLVRREPWLYGPLLVLAPWVRPEGMICVMAFAGCAVLRALCGRWAAIRRLPEVRWADWVYMALGLASVVGVFAFNYALTGDCQFSSVARKGHFFLANSLAGGLRRTATDFVAIFKAYFLGIPQGGLRDLVFLPVLGAALAWLGVFGFKGRKRGDWRLAVWLLAVFGGLVSVASSGWQNTNFDRYFAWLLPTVPVASALGIEVLEHRGAFRSVARLAGGIAVLWAFGGAVVALASFSGTSRLMAGFASFARQCDEVIPAGASVGTTGYTGIAYFLSERRVVNLPGVYSPELFNGEWLVGQFEILKNEPKTRFDYWQLEAEELDRELGFKLEGTLGRQVLVGPHGHELLLADWSPLTAAAGVSQLPGTAREMKARVDVGYEKEERGADYEILPRYVDVSFAPFLKKGENAGKTIVEGGRLVVGQDEMTIPTVPGKDLTVVMRTGDRCKAVQKSEFTSARRSYEFANPLKLNLQVDGVPAGMGVAPLATNAFSDVTFTIPGKFITKERSRIAFCGDHVAYAYWFYQ